MGPRSFERGDTTHRSKRLGGPHASMGPRSFERGDCLRQKIGRPASSLQWGRALSSAETRQVGGQRQLEGLVLQWGRALSSAETPDDVLGGEHRHRLQWGRALSSAETNGLPQFVLVSRIRLQWGRALSSAETRRAGLWLAGGIEPSMGPRSFERGDPATPLPVTPDPESPSMGPRSFERGDWPQTAPARSTSRSLQWGRALSSAETRACACWPPTQARLQWGRALSSAETERPARNPPIARPFNGAALFRARRPRTTWPASRQPSAFNGAALFRARRHWWKATARSSAGCLQWGRALSSAETGPLLWS